jgi:hypothetical protein
MQMNKPLFSEVYYTVLLVPCISMYMWFLYTTEETWKADKASNYVPMQSD